MTALTVLVLGAGPASAHAQLESTDPLRGSEHTTAPRSVSLDFDEAVTLVTQSIRVLDPAGRDVTAGPVGHPGGRGERVQVALPASLPRGSYLVIWRVVSDDSHPVSGSFTFGVGVAAAPLPDTATTSTTSTSDPLVTTVHDTLQFEALGGSGILLGGAFFLAVLWPAGLTRLGCRRLVTIAWWVAVVSTAALVLLEGPYGGTLPLSDLSDLSLLRGTLDSSYGKLLLLRLLTLGGCGGLWWAIRRRGYQPGRLDLAGLVLLLLESFSFAGHSGQGSLMLLWSTVDAAHLAAAGIWVGGLLVVAVVLRRRGATLDGGSDDVAQVLRRWSAVAAVAVSVLLVTGVAQGLREVGGWAALVATAYGQILLAKVAGLALMLGLALVTRRRIGRRPRSARGTVTVEAGLGVVVLGLAAVLTSTVPAREDYQPTFTTTVAGHGPAGRESRVGVVVRPTTPGYEGMSARVTSLAGVPVRLTAATGDFVDTDLGIGPLTVTMTVSPAGIVDDVLITVPSPGRWVVTLRLTAADGTTYAASLSYLVG